MKVTDLFVKQSEIENFAIDETYLIEGGYIQANIDSDLVIDMVNSPFMKSEDYKNGDYFISTTLYIKGTENENKVILRIDFTDEFQSEDEEDKTVTEFYNIVGDSVQEIRNNIFRNFLDGISDHIEALSL